jgi:hypothetical protein
MKETKKPELTDSQKEKLRAEKAKQMSKIVKK